MTNPGPPGDERPLVGPDADMGLPESGTQHATSTDYPTLGGATAGASEFPLGATPPAAVPTPPAYEDASELVDPVPGSGALDAEPTPAYDALAEESGLAPAEPTVTTLSPDYYADHGSADSGPLAKVKQFAGKSPAAFIGAALVAGWLVGKLFGSSDDDD
jgi:hypothetical protein